MAKVNLKEKIKTGLFLLDGAMGTELFARGVEAGQCSDALNLDSPEIVADVHNCYFQAGSDAVITNTFGANKYALGRHNFADKVSEINTAGAEIARKEAGEEKYVLGDIGPCGDFLEPVGMVKPDELKQAFSQQAQALLDGHVDGFIIETMTAIEEIEIAIQAVQSVNTDLPVFASMSFDMAAGDYRTMMGVDVKTAIEKIVSLGADAVGFNCGTTSLDEYIELANRYVSIVKSLNSDVHIYAEPNAGKPQLADGETIYNVTADEFAGEIEKIHSLGINIIGGCCGTSPAHIKAVAEKLRS